MTAKSKRLEERNGSLSLNEAIDGLNLAKASSVTPAKDAFVSTNDLLTTIRVCFISV